jgi:chorismate synthase
VLEGLPAGLTIDRAAIDRWLARRQHGFGRSGRQQIERDAVEVTGGLRDGRTLGAPLVLEIGNRDWKNWLAVMDPWQVDQMSAGQRAVTSPRPGHADLAGGLASELRAAVRIVLERASARESAARVAAGAVCNQLLTRYGIGCVPGCGSARTWCTTALAGSCWPRCAPTHLRAAPDDERPRRRGARGASW